MVTTIISFDLIRSSIVLWIILIRDAKIASKY